MPRTLTCATCGDPIEGADCPRCNWGGWSNVTPHDNTANPADPTIDMHRGIQASAECPHCGSQQPYVWQSSGDQVGPEYHGTFAAYHPDHPHDYMGHVSYSYWGDDPQGPSVGMQMIETDPKYRRQGVGTALYNRLKQEFPNERIDWGMMTDEGAALRNSLDQRKTKTRGPREEFSRVIPPDRWWLG